MWECHQHHLTNGKDIKLLPSGLAFKTKDKPIVITHLQFPGKQIISSKDAINSYAEFFK